MTNPQNRAADERVDEVRGDAGPADIEQQYQDPMDHPAVRVVHDGPLMVQQLPADGPWDSVSRALAGAGDSQRLLKIDGRRGRFVVIGTVAFRMGNSQQSALVGGLVPPNVPLPMHTTGEVWIARDAADSVVSAFWESWTR